MDDERLVRALARGDGRALERTYRAHKDALYSVAYHLLGETAAAEDALHDAFVGLACQARSLPPETRLRPYLLASVANHARDQLRRRRGLGDDPAPLAAELTHEPSPPQRLEREDEAARIARHLARLPEEQREVVVLHVYGELTFRAIADLGSLSINTVTSRYRYALEALRLRLGDEEAGS